MQDLPKSNDERLVVGTEAEKEYARLFDAKSVVYFEKEPFVSFENNQPRVTCWTVNGEPVGLSVTEVAPEGHLRTVPHMVRA